MSKEHAPQAEAADGEPTEQAKAAEPDPAIVGIDMTKSVTELTPEEDRVLGQWMVSRRLARASRIKEEDWHKYWRR